MSIAILVGGQSSEGNAEHRFLVAAFLKQFGDQVSCIITAEPQRRPLLTRLHRAIKRGRYRERFARARYKKPYGPNGSELSKALFGNAPLENMPGGERKFTVSSHNDVECEQILDRTKPEIIVVYGTQIIRDNIFRRAGIVTLNMHTGLSPYYRGDSTLFWPIYYNDREHIGVTVHKLVAEVDGGDIVHTGRISYTAGDTEASIFAKGVNLGTNLYLQAVQEALDKTIVYHPQNLSLGREFRWIHRTVAAERQVLETLTQWAAEIK